MKFKAKFVLIVLIVVASIVFGPNLRSRTRLALHTLERSEICPFLRNMTCLIVTQIRLLERYMRKVESFSRHFIFQISRARKIVV